jgi:predicted alpha/beta hydrolase
LSTLSFAARDGFVLSGDRFEPSSGARGVAVVAGAMGVRRRFYEAFAAYLAENGLASLTFDYRGVGDSRPSGPLSGFRAELHQWGEEDLAGAVAFAEATWPGVPLVLVGHSVGGQLVGLAHNAEKLAAMLLVASQSGYWRLWPFPARLRMVLTWHLAIPALTRIFGYLPLSRLGAGADVPGGVALEWARWGRHPRYVLSWADTRPEARYASIACPLRSIAVADDHFYAPRAPVEALVAMYPKARSEVVVASPAQAGARSIGHFGYFRSVHRATLWREALEWIEQAGSARQAPRST